LNTVDDPTEGPLSHQPAGRDRTEDPFAARLGPAAVTGCQPAL
jgi:hypothetical protein